MCLNILHSTVEWKDGSSVGDGGEGTPGRGIRLRRFPVLAEGNFALPSPKVVLLTEALRYLVGIELSPNGASHSSQSVNQGLFHKDPEVFA